ncbi:Lipase, GDSL [Cynara cardunculus var. scolymus]|uniref:Lipase, GDSL n=1 Tax=Cynara cardunculus var. scolymus TaxID=59895 RepID=A0A124SDD2_CYNCS|nr:Lipase, GDSL [Cynara cardunculus var. scolymus]
MPKHLVPPPPPFSFLVTQQLMSEQTRSCPKAKYEPISLIMGSTFSIQDPQGVSATASIVPIFYNIVSMSEQIKQFETIYGNLTLVKGRHATKTLLARSMFAVSVGSNDLFGYFESRSTVDPVIFINSLMTAYGCHINVSIYIISNFYSQYDYREIELKDRHIVKALYNLGARKFGIIGVPPIGCCPSQRIHNGTGGCLEIENTFARAFHSALDALMKQLASKLPEMKYALGNSYEMTINVINQAQLFTKFYLICADFKSVDTACCGEGWLNAEKTCTPEANMCSNRDEYLFWDLYHPTQYAAELAAMTLYNGGPQFVTPINFAQLVAY